MYKRQVVEKYHPDRILIEPSGVGKLSDVIKAVQGVEEDVDIQLDVYKRQSQSTGTDRCSL